MKPFEYGASLKQEDGGFSVSFPGVPEALAEGNTRAEALANAQDALETALSFYVDAGEPLPRPAKTRASVTVAVSPVAQLKLSLYEAMRETKTSKAALARKLGKFPPHIDRLLDLTHQSKIDALAEALAAVGKKVVLAVEDA